MSETTTETTETTTATVAAGDTTETGSTEETETSTAAESGDTDWEKEAARLRSELSKARRWEKQAKEATTKLKDADPVKIKAEITSAVAKAMGLAEDPPDPAQLTEQLTAQRVAARDAQVELAVYRVSKDADADPAALLDSRSFMESLKDIDPADTDAVKAAVDAAVAGNAALKGAQGRRLPGVNKAQGTSSAGQPDLETEIAAAKKTGDWQKVVALENQKLLNPIKQ